MPNEKDIQKIQEMVLRYSQVKDCSEAYGMDVAIVKKSDGTRDLALIEIGPFVAMGSYGCRGTFLPQLYQKGIQWILQLSMRLQNVEILNRDFRKVLKSYNAENVFVYADCPYLGTEDYYENVFSMQDHKGLAEMLKSHKGKFALSSKAKKDLRKLYRSNNHYVLNFEMC